MKKRKWMLLCVLIAGFLEGCGSRVGTDSLKITEFTKEREVISSTARIPEETKETLSEYTSESTDAKVELGYWDYVTFSNRWANIKMTVPENAAIFLRDQFPLFVTIKENQIWDTILMLNDWDSSISIYYEKKEDGMNVDTFLQQKFKELEAPEGLANQINGSMDVIVGNELYCKLETSIRNDKYTDFYVREKDGYFIVIQTKSTPFKLEEIKQIIETIVPVNEEMNSM